MIRSVKTIAAALAGLLIAAAQANAHPHVWVTMKSEVVYAPDGTVTGIRHAWTFDDMFSTFALQGLESKEKGKLTREELQPLAEVNVTSLKEYDFFTFGKVNGKKLDFVEPKDYHLELSKDQLLTLHFMLPLKAPVQTKTMDFEVYDPGYFVDFQLEKDNPVALAGAPAGCKFELGKPKELDKDLTTKLAQIPPDGKIPDDLGDALANKIRIRCQ